MKIILLQDIKGKGKKYDVIDIASGYATFLIKEGQAKMATSATIEEIKKIKDEQERQAAEQYAIASSILEKVQSAELTIFAKGTPKGTLQKTITKDQLLQYLPSYASNYIKEFAPKAIEMDPIKKFGSHTIVLNLFYSNLLKNTTVKGPVSVTVVQTV